jgi:hypothetical protein
MILLPRVAEELKIPFVASTFNDAITILGETGLTEVSG